jgi:N-acetylneuraminate synthase|tara:strand:- start:90 stop:950 length:861 start_codon:yes stop_codon:yes gene_type:complete
MLEFEKINGTYLIGEIGINHNGEIEIAKKLIDAAYAIGWDCVKFQKRNPDICIPADQKKVMKSTPWGEMTYLEYKKKIEFDKVKYDLINDYCSNKSQPMHWSASVWDMDSLKFILDYNVPFIKIPSAMVTDIDLIKESSKSNKPIILSTGMSTLDEIDNAVNEISKNTHNLCILHSNSCYPAKSKDLNLSLIPFYIKRYQYTIGYSGHEFSIEPSVIATALGAKVVERHITLNQELWGTDQKASLSITGMDRLYNRIKDAHLSIGKPEKIVTKDEMEIRKKLRKKL